MSHETRIVNFAGRPWCWPAYDTELEKVVWQANDLQRIMQHTTIRSGVALQAGGACGVWPEMMLDWFDYVYTFEPDPLNFHCLTENVDRQRVIACNAALGGVSGVTYLANVKSESTNAGARFTIDDVSTVPVPKGMVPRQVQTTTIDEHIGLYDLDLICLDVEGCEALALYGGINQIQRALPTIVIEEKQLPQGNDPLQARRLLTKWGYEEVDRVSRDVIFRHPKRPGTH